MVSRAGLVERVSTASPSTRSTRPGLAAEQQADFIVRTIALMNADLLAAAL